MGTSEQRGSSGQPSDMREAQEQGAVEQGLAGKGPGATDRGTGPGEGSSSATTGPMKTQGGAREAGTNDTNVSSGAGEVGTSD